jgi:hypothetical protein
MKRAKVSSAIIGLLGFAALVLVASTPAKAAFVVGGENGWQMSFDGMINAFMVYDSQSNLHYKNGAVKALTAEQSFRVRTGLLPSIFAFNVKSPTINGVDYGARIGIYPQIENATTHTGLGPGTYPGTTVNGGTSVDFREIFFTADGKFGQVLAGRALNLFEGKNILTDMTLIGLGVPLNLTGLGVSTGYIGRGYTYPSFGSQFRYTTPDMGGLKLAVAICDPSKIIGPTTVATQVNTPRVETELSYARALPNGKISAWVSALYQNAKVTGVEFQQVGAQHKVTSIAGAGGMQLNLGNFETVLSGFGGSGIGAFLTQDGGDALDAFGKERVTYGGLFHATYTIGAAKLGAQYGINYSDKTDAESVLGTSTQKSNQAVTGGIYYSVNKYMTLIGEYTYTIAHNYDSSRITQNVVALGTVFTW